MRFPKNPQLRAITTRNQREAYRMWCLKKERSGDPVVCFGMYRWLAPQGTARRRKELVEWQTGRESANRIRPKWCSAVMWQSFRTYQNRYRADITIDDYRTWREMGVWPESKFFATPKTGSTFSRPVADILAKFARRGQTKKGSA
jgi:hypothetical protein